MIGLKELNTYRKLILLISIFLIGFISLFSLNQLFTKLISELDQQSRNLEAKLTIGEFLAYDVLKIRSLFNELATTATSKRSRDILKEDIYKTIDSINEALVVLEKGGTLKRKIALNIVGHLSTTEVIEYKRLKGESFSLEVIDIRPKLVDIKNMIKELESLLGKRDKSRKLKNNKEFLDASRDLRRYYKAMPAFFNRLSENIRRLLYEGGIELSELEKAISHDKHKYLQLKLLLIFSIVAVVLSLGYLIIKRVNQDSEKLHELNIKLNKNLVKVEKQQKSIRAILDGQQNIIIVSNGVSMIDANKQLFKFFDYNNFEEFKAEHDCICDFFETNIPNDDYIVNKDYNGLNWAEYILANPHRNFKIIMKKGNKKHFFSILVTQTLLSEVNNETVVIITLNDITNEINSQVKLKALNDNLELIVDNKTKELQELNENLEEKVKIESAKVREKDKQMMQQARFAAMGEMIGNIAHQWRQPLSAINSTSSSMKLQLQLGIATDDEVNDSYDKIMNYVDFLNQTIEDFRGFFMEDKEVVQFNMSETVDKSLTITSAVYKDNDINIFFDKREDNLICKGLPSELSQVFLNILNNAKDALISNRTNKRYVKITYAVEENDNVIYIHDNAGGIPENIIEKIFDPYFTTKHQAQGTGIGLYMSKDIVEKHLKGSLNVENKSMDIDGQAYTGACFRIALPKV
jgi:signal transduction histidine kinase